MNAQQNIIEVVKQKTIDFLQIFKRMENDGIKKTIEEWGAKDTRRREKHSEQQMEQEVLSAKTSEKIMQRTEDCGGALFFFF